MNLKFLNYHNFNFSFDFFQRGVIHSFYQSILNPTSKEVYKNKAFKESENCARGIEEIKFIPYLLQLNSPKNKENYNIISFYRVENFYINLEGFTSAEDYLKSQMGSKSRSQLRMRKQRLEKCFDVEYKFYHGKIDEQKYNEIFDAFEHLIKKRFNQRGDLFSQKNNLSTIRANSYQMILKKKSSFFVIYADRKIIDVCLNYHFQNVVQHFIRSYDIDYSKFGLGQIDIYKQLEICFEYNFTIFDFMWGKMKYKTRWSNKSELYKHDFIYRKTPINKPIILLLICLYKFHDALKTNKLYTSIQEKLIGSEHVKPENVIVRTEELQNKIPVNLYEKISVKNDLYSFLRKTIFDFQYLNFEKTSDTNVYKIDDKSYLISGINKQLKIYLS